MAENTPQSSEFVKAMGDAVSDNRKKLTESKTNDGTDLGFVDLMSLKGSMNEFMESCPKKLDAGNSCTGVFNTNSGKKVGVDLSYSGLNVEITNSAGDTTRKVKFEPPKQQSAKIQLASNGPS